MKNTLFVTMLFLATNCFAQVTSEKVDELKRVNIELSTEKDSIIKVVYKKEMENNKKPAYFLNGQLTSESILRTLNPNEIGTVNVEKGDFVINNVKYFGKLKIELKSSYSPKLISLNNLKAKYTNLSGNQTIFKIDNEIVNSNYDNFIIDEKFILKIIVENYENKEEKLNVNFINLITKTEENIKKSKQLIIRGNNEFAINK